MDWCGFFAKAAMALGVLVKPELSKFRNRKAPKNLDKSRLSASSLARLKGFEPPASSLGGTHSIQLSYKRILNLWDSLPFASTFEAIVAP